MKYNVAQLLKGPRGATRTYQVDEEPEFHIEGLSLLGPVRGAVQLMRTQQGILAEADLTVDAEVSCSRCLKPVRTTLSVHVEEEFRPTIDIITGHRVWPEPEETLGDDVMIDAQHVLDLDEVARQEFEVAIPLKSLCRDECPGLCPQCGEEIGGEQCRCRPAVDPRLSRLGDLLKEVATQ